MLAEPTAEDRAVSGGVQGDFFCIRSSLEDSIATQIKFIPVPHLDIDALESFHNCFVAIRCTWVIQHGKFDYLPNHFSLEPSEDDAKARLVRTFKGPSVIVQARRPAI